MDCTLATADLGLVVTTTGGSVWRFFAKQDGREVPLFREPRGGPQRAALEAGCFPLVPFGNRVRGNRFSFDGSTHSFAPNVPWDRHVLHGDGWMGEWQVLQHGQSELRLGYEHRAEGTPYSYMAEQVFTLDQRTLTLGLSVLNTGDSALPFGLGWHPFFPLTPDTTLQAHTRSYWDEDASWLPTVEHATGGDLDFTAGAHLAAALGQHAIRGLGWPRCDPLAGSGLSPAYRGRPSSRPLRRLRAGSGLRAGLCLRPFLFRADEPQRRRATTGLMAAAYGGSHRARGWRARCASPSPT